MEKISIAFDSTKTPFLLFGSDIGGTLAKVVFISNDEATEEYLKSQMRQNIVKIEKIYDHNIIFCQFKSKDFIELVVKKVGSIQEMGHGDTLQLKVALSGGGASRLMKEVEVILGQKPNIVGEFDGIISGLSLISRIKSSPFYNFKDGEKHEIKDLDLSRKRENHTGKYGYPILVVSLGSGTSLLKIDQEHKFTRIGGLNVGGGVFLGLCRSILGLNSFEEILNLALSRDSGADLDLDYSQNQGLGDYIVALGSLNIDGSPQEFNDEQKSELAMSILKLVCGFFSETIILEAKAHCAKSVWFTGSLIRSNIKIPKLINSLLEFYQGRFKVDVDVFFTEFDGFMGSVGCLYDGICRIVDDPEWN